MTDKAKTPEGKSNADYVLKILKHDPISGETKAAFFPKVRHRIGRKKVDLETLTFSGRDVHTFCPSSDRNGELKEGAEYSFEPKLLRAYVDYQVGRTLGYELKITRLGSEGDVDAKIYPGKGLKKNTPTIKDRNAHLSKEQLEELHPAFSKGREAKEGSRFVVKRKDFEDFYLTRGEPTIDPALEEIGTGLRDAIDEGFSPSDLEGIQEEADNSGKK